MDLSLLWLRDVEVVVDLASSCWSSVACFSALASAGVSLVDPPLKKARLSLFLSCRAGRFSIVGDLTLVPLTRLVGLTDGAVVCKGDAVAANQEPVGERTMCPEFAGIRVASSR